MSTEQVYLSGPMTNKPGFNFSVFDSAQRFLRDELGWHSISPAEHDREVIRRRFMRGEIEWPNPEVVPGYDEGDVVKYAASTGAVPDLLAWDFQQIIDPRCTGIVMLPGWEGSTGARAERFVAEAVGKHVYLLTEPVSLNPPEWVISSDIEQRRLHDHVAEFATPTVVPTFQVILEREMSLREDENWEHAAAIFASINDNAPLPTVPVDSFEQLPTLQVATAPPGYEGEVRVVDAATGGAKGTKLARFDLLPSDAIWKIAEHFGRGARKYADRNWEQGFDWSLAYAAAQRHLARFWMGQDVDHDPSLYATDEEHSDNPVLHITAAAWECIVLLAFVLRDVGNDNRPSSTPTAPRWEASDLR